MLCGTRGHTRLRIEGPRLFHQLRDLDKLHTELYHALGVSLSQTLLSNSEEPSICLSCTNLLLKQEIEQLKNELKGLAEVRSRCSTLTNEVSSLRRALNTISKEPATLSATRSAAKQPKRTYARVVSTLRASSFLPAPNASNNGASRTTEASQVQATGESRKSTLSGQRKIKVDGTRRIWNTMPTCTARAASQAQD